MIGSYKWYMKYYELDGETLQKFAPLCCRSLPRTVNQGQIPLGAVDGEAGNEPAGILLTHFDEDFLYLDWIFVREGYRRRGIGRELVSRVVNAVREEGSIPAVYVACSDKEPEARAFFASLGIMIEYQDSICELHSRLDETIEAAPKANIPGLIPVKDVPKRAINAFSNMIGALGENGTTEKLPLDRDAYIEESLAFFADDEIKAIVLVAKVDEFLEIRWAYAKPGCLKLLGAAMREVHRRVRENYPPETRVAVGTMRSVTMDLVKHFLPKAEVIHLGWDVVDIDDIKC